MTQTPSIKESSTIWQKIKDCFASIPRLKYEENGLYLIIWLVVFLAFFALGSLKPLIPFVFLFIIHNYVIFPLLFREKRRAWYFVATAVLFSLFTIWVLTDMESPRRMGRPDPGEFPQGNEMTTGGRPDGFAPAPSEEFRQRQAPPRRDDKERGKDNFSERDSSFRASAPQNRLTTGFERGNNRPEPPRRGELEGEIPPPFGPPLMRIMMGLLILLANLGVKMFFKSRENEQRMISLEKENLDQQLQYLRYQINPHFFMNTLNNIHALVDIDPEQAKASILELSRMMRYILYEGNKPTIPLSKETEFLRHYIYLMRIRFADSVKIDVDLPEESGNVEIPPLLFVSFVENAFKHGISYEEESFIKVSMNLDSGKLIFKCLNSRHEANSDKYSGIGQSNVRKRLDLLYGNNYTLHIEEDDKVYDVLVVIPVSVPDTGSSDEISDKHNI